VGSKVFTVLSALAWMKSEIQCERITDSVAKRRAAGKDLGEQHSVFTYSKVHSAH
jgi:DNA invertase Pin-like site-specific DNA recombinase